MAQPRKAIYPIRVQIFFLLVYIVMYSNTSNMTIISEYLSIILET